MNEVSTHTPVPLSTVSTTRRPGESERGFVLAMTALLLIPLMIFAALAVDVGGWYARSSEIQRAADSAALAAVVYMPNETKATTAALDAAAQNGFVDGVDGVDVQVTSINSQSIRVDITADGDFYFGGAAVQDDVSIQRFATAEYNLPVPMGNPSSALGTGNQAQAGNPADGIQLSVNAYCTGLQQGDQISVRYQGSSYSCPASGTLNPQYDPEGFYYVVDFPSGALTQSWTIQFYEPGLCSSREWTASGSQAAGASLVTRLYAADDTQITDEDNIVVTNLWPSLPSNQTVKTFGNTEGCVSGSVNDRWISAYTIPSGATPGRWILNTRTAVDTTERGINNFAIRVVPTTALTSVCTTVGGINLGTCPRVFAKEYLSVYAAADDSWGVPILTAGPAAFYLAEIGPEHAGKTLELELFDPGEGMNNMQIVAPDRTRPSFTWETTDAAELGILGITDDPVTNNSTCATSVTASDPTTTVAGTYACLRVNTTPNFNGETVRIRMTIPANSGCVGSNCWWRIRYQPNGTGGVTDRTVWSVRVIGDPVRLTE